MPYTHLVIACAITRQSTSQVSLGCQCSVRRWGSINKQPYTQHQSSVTCMGRSAEAYKLQASSQAGTAPPAVLPTNPAPAHHNKFMTASAPGAEADASAEGQSLSLADPAMMPAAAGSNPLRQKSSLWAARETEDDDAQAAARDVIPSLPRVTYSDGGTARVATYCCLLPPRMHAAARTLVEVV